MIPVNSIEKLHPPNFARGRKTPIRCRNMSCSIRCWQCTLNMRMVVRILLADGFDETTVDTVMRLVDRAEWKRRQYPLGPKVTALAFGRDRRLPITNAFRE